MSDAICIMTIVRWYSTSKYMDINRKALHAYKKVAFIRVIKKYENKSDVGRRFGFSLSTVTII